VEVATDSMLYADEAQEKADRVEFLSATSQFIEKHHILPKGLKLGGEKDPNNYVFLTAKEHFVCHKLLLKMLTGHFHRKMLEGLSIFFNNNNRNLRFTSKDYVLLKQANG